MARRIGGHLLHGLALLPAKPSPDLDVEWTAWRWAMARVVPYASCLCGIALLVVTVAAGGSVANALFAATNLPFTVGRAVGGALVGLVVGVVILSAWCLLRAPYEQRDALRHLVREGAAAESVSEIVEWLRTETVAVYNKGRTVTLAEVVGALQKVGISRWTREEWIRFDLTDNLPASEGEAGQSNAELVLPSLADHDLVEDRVIELADHEPIPRSPFGYSVITAGLISDSGDSVGTRAVDKSYRMVKFTAQGRQVARLLARP
jgi:hypothetical protein